MADLPYTNNMPRMTQLVDPKTGKISNDWVGFFTKLPARTGGAIATVSSTDSLAQIGLSVNALLAEARQQNWIKDSTSGTDQNFAEVIKAVTMIPAAGDFVYNTTDIHYYIYDPNQPLYGGSGINASPTYDYTNLTLNTNNDGSYPAINALGFDPTNYDTDFTISIAELQNELPSLQKVSLFSGWFGNDLRASQCQIRPGIDRANKITGIAKAEGNFQMQEFPWRVAGLLRNQVPVISATVQMVWGTVGFDDSYTGLVGDPNPQPIYGWVPIYTPAYGSTPADSSVIEGIQALKAAGYAVTFTPFIFMDIPAGNSLPSPYGGTQAAYPWRGRITLDTAIGLPGTSDQTAAAAAEIDAFVNGTWGYRNFILHYANLCAQAGGVDTFVIGSEMRGLTWARSDKTTFPFVDALVQLAADVAAILPNANIVYTADWSENLSYRPADGSGDIYFHLDKLFMSPNIAAVAFDNYWPLSDWRDVPMDGTNNADELKFPDIYDFGYLMSNVQGGEGYDWYYATPADRANQVRTPITDGAYDEPWVWRYKDIWNWWNNSHYNRIGGVRQTGATEWLPQSKPIWMMECGCPAVDKGSNQPNVFVDPKSSESFYPYFSNSNRDDLIQQRYAHAILRFFDETDSDFTPGRNPESAVYSGRMVDVSRIYLYTWDARPYPIFPDCADIWADSNNYQTGDWINGRIPPLANPALVTGGSLTQPRTILAPRDPQIVTPANGNITKQWYIFFQGLGYTQGDAIPDLPANPSAAEIAAALNALLAALRNQNRIASS